MSIARKLKRKDREHVTGTYCPNGINRAARRQRNHVGVYFGNEPFDIADDEDLFNLYRMKKARR